MHRLIITSILLVFCLLGFPSKNSNTEIVSENSQEIGSITENPTYPATVCPIRFILVEIENTTGCADNEYGSICVTIEGDITTEFELSIDNGVTWTYGEETVCKEDLVAGSYNLIIRDQGHCQVIYSGNPVILSVDNPLTIDDIVTTSQTNDTLGSITVTASGQPPLKYTLDGGTWQSINIFDSLEFGTYRVDVKDRNGCIVSEEAIIADERCPEFTVDTFNETNCFSPNGIIIFTAIGIRPFNYSIDNGTSWHSDSVFTDLPGGLYQLAVKAYNGCITYSTTTVGTSFISFSATSHVQDITGCAGDATGEILATAFGGKAPKEFTINNGITWQTSGTFTGLIAGEYTEIVMDDFGCTDTAIFTITEPVVLSFSITLINPVCTGENSGQIRFRSVSGGTGTITYSVDGGSSYSSSSTITGLAAGSYNLQIKDGNDCIKSYSGNPVTLTDPSTFVIDNVESADNTTCGTGNGSISITYSYESPTPPVTKTGIALHYYYSIDDGVTWQTDSSVFRNLTGGDYSVWARSPQGCLAEWESNPVVVEDISPITFDSILVAGDDGRTIGQIEVFVSGGTSPYNYRLDEGPWQSSALFTSLAAATYNVQVIDTEGCEKVQDAIVDSLVYIPDAIFKTYLVGNASINTNGDSAIQVTEARAFSANINVSGMGISDMTGIETFINLRELSCIGNSFTSIDLSQNKFLTTLICYNNQLSSLDVSNNELLITLNCNNNLLTELNVENNTAITSLSCGSNTISALDVSKNNLLTTISCPSNSLTELDLTQNSLLTNIFCHFNSLSTLDLRNGNNINVTSLLCTDNPYLNCVMVDNVTYSNTNWKSYFDPGVKFNLDCSNWVPEDDEILNTSFNLGDTMCFGAYQTITVGDRKYPVDFNVGSSTSLIAGSSIHFLPGVYIYEGAYLSATITSDSTFCDEASGSIVEVVAKTVKITDQQSIQKENKPTEELPSIQAFPNPNNGNFCVKLNGFQEEVDIAIYNSLGSTIYKEKIRSEKTTINLTNIPKGLYFIKTTNTKSVLTQKIIIN